MLSNALNRLAVAPPVCSGVLERDKCWLFVVTAVEAEADVVVDADAETEVNVKGDGDADVDDVSSSGVLVVVDCCSGCSGCVAVTMAVLELLAALFWPKLGIC